MPRYQATYESENITIEKHLDRPSIEEVIDAIIVQEYKDWDGKIISIELKYLGE